VLDTTADKLLVLEKQRHTVYRWKDIWRYSGVMCS